MTALGNVIDGQGGCYALCTRVHPETWAIVASSGLIAAEANSQSAARDALSRVERKASLEAHELRRIVGMPVRNTHCTGRPEEQPDFLSKQPRVWLGHAGAKRGR